MNYIPKPSGIFPRNAKFGSVFRRNKVIHHSNRIKKSLYDQNSRCERIIWKKKISNIHLWLKKKKRPLNKLGIEKISSTCSFSLKYQFLLQRLSEASIEGCTFCISKSWDRGPSCNVHHHVLWGGWRPYKTRG